MYKLTRLIFISFILCHFSQADEILTLEKCIEIGLSNNHSIKLIEKKLSEAKAKKQEAFGNYLPNLTYSYTYTRMSEAPSIKMASPSFTPVMVKDLLTNTNIMGALITGYQQYDIKMGQENNYTSKITLTQPLFTWGKIYQINKQAKLNYELVEYEYKKTKNEVIFNIKQAVYSVLLAQKFNEIANEAVKVMERHYEVIQSFYKEGKVSNVDVSRVEVQLVNAKTNKIKSDNSLKLSKKYLFNLINLTESNDYQIQGTLEYTPLNLNLDELFKIAIENRVEIKQIELQKTIANSFLSLTKSELRPDLSFIYNYQYQKPYYFEDEWKSNWNAILLLNFPLFTGLKNLSKSNQIKSQIEQIDITKDQLEKMIKLEVEKAYLNLIESKDRIEAQQTNVKLAKENLDSIQKRYEKGLVSDLDLRDTQLALTQAETEYFQALYDYNLALANLEKAIGK